jgi:hypothetical protein
MLLVSEYLKIVPDTKQRSQQCVKRNHNPKGNYKIECRATPDKCEGRIRCLGGMSIPCLMVTLAVSLISVVKFSVSRLGERNNPQPICESSQVNGKIRIQNQCPDQVHGIIHSEN